MSCIACVVHLTAANLAYEDILCTQSSTVTEKDHGNWRHAYHCRRYLLWRKMLTCTSPKTLFALKNNKCKIFKDRYVYSTQKIICKPKCATTLLPLKIDITVQSIHWKCLQIHQKKLLAVQCVWPRHTMLNVKIHEWQLLQLSWTGEYYSSIKHRDLQLITSHTISHIWQQINI